MSQILPAPSSANMDSSNQLFLLDAVTYWLLEVSSAFMLSAAHNVLFFVLDIRTPVIHFLHHFFTFTFLLTKSLVARRFPSLQLGGGKTGSADAIRALITLWPSVMVQGLVTILSSQVHSQNRTGSLYLLRLFDFLTTLTILKLCTYSPLLEAPTYHRKRYKLYSLLVPVALFASLSWLEFGHIEYDSWSLMLAPFLAIAQGVQVVMVKRAEHRFRFDSRRGGGCDFDDDEFEDFALHYTGLVSLVLALPALVSYSHSVVSYDASWESIDYVLMSMSVVFMCGFKYAELWLLVHLELYNYCVLEHSRYFLASCGQWFLQNMAHATVYATCGKAVFLAATFRYWHGVKGLESGSSCAKPTLQQQKRAQEAE